MTDLQLASTDQIIVELMSRTEGMVMAYIQGSEGGGEVLKTRWSKGLPCVERIGMASILHANMLDDFELKEDKNVI